MELLMHFIYGFFATFGFALIFQTPKRAVIISSIIGGIGWIINKYLGILENTVVSTIVAALTIGILSAISSIVIKCPNLVIYLPAIIPLVPGGGMYYSMSYLINLDYGNFTTKVLETLVIAMTMATGIFLGTTFIGIVRKIINTRRVANNKKPI